MYPVVDCASTLSGIPSLSLSKSKRLGIPSPSASTSPSVVVSVTASISKSVELTPALFVILIYLKDSVAVNVEVTGDVEFVVIGVEVVPKLDPSVEKSKMGVAVPEFPALSCHVTATGVPEGTTSPKSNVIISPSSIQLADNPSDAPIRFAGLSTSVLSWVETTVTKVVSLSSVSKIPSLSSSISTLSGMLSPSVSGSTLVSL